MSAALAPLPTSLDLVCQGEVGETPGTESYSRAPDPVRDTPPPQDLMTDRMLLNVHVADGSGEEGGATQAGDSAPTSFVTQRRLSAVHDGPMAVALVTKRPGCGH
ncbi:hypothetical protein DHEL01_v211034 [Diaporthe helianthi]|uniref:Uncharacterized protein n=1 Tax=Diaporthe helianthi TaxID=158607 RepID=A0A2P5HJZ1_DIAHE|nr:hypothetical protein DHEL01_v211034 [Diaporthe helianthi]